RRQFQVHPRAGPADVDTVVGVTAAAGRAPLGLVGVFSKYPEGGLIADLATVPHGVDGAVLGPHRGRHHAAQRVLSFLGNHVDNAVYRVSAPDCGARTAYHLDAVNILEHRVLHVPIHTRIER